LKGCEFGLLAYIVLRKGERRHKKNRNLHYDDVRTESGEREEKKEENRDGKKGVTFRQTACSSMFFVKMVQEFEPSLEIQLLKLSVTNLKIIYPHVIFSFFFLCFLLVLILALFR